MIKPLSLKDKSVLVPIILGIILVIIVFAIVIVSLAGTNTTTNSNTNTPSTTDNNLSIQRVIPDEPETLTAGSVHTFLIYFNKKISYKNFRFSLTYADITQDNPQQIPVKISLSMLGSNVVSVKTFEPIKERSEYYLTVIDPSSNTELSSTSYLSGDIQPTKIPTNDQTLKQYLPHDTNTYTLQYNAAQNLYIFNFKFDPTLPGNITQQYEDAKAQAIQYIESKGVNPNNITIQYRSS